MNKMNKMNNMNEMNEITEGLKDYIHDKIQASLTSEAVITTKDIKYNLNSCNIRYSLKLATEIITAMSLYYNIERLDYKLTFGQVTKDNYQYLIKNK